MTTLAGSKGSPSSRMVAIGVTSDPRPGITGIATSGMGPNKGARSACSSPPPPLSSSGEISLVKKWRRGERGGGGEKGVGQV